MGFFSNLKNAITGKKNTNEYISGFSKTNDAIGRKLRFKATNLDPETFTEDLMVTLIEADMGYKTAQKVCDIFTEKTKQKFFKDEEYIIECVGEAFRDIYNSKEESQIKYNENGPTVNLIIGVNGSGKTTSIAKLANKYKNEGKKVLLVAADTFRAGAIDQLDKWSKKIGCEIVLGKEGQDPSSVLVDGCRKAKEINADIVLCDTAGRLQNKVNLMNELEKMNRVIGKEIEGGPHNTWLVLDANTGQNGLSQAELFSGIANLNGIILTKMDGTSKGGIIIAIKDQTGIPVRYFCDGEGIENIQDFDFELYLYSIIGDLTNGSQLQ